MTTETRNMLADPRTITLPPLIPAPIPDLATAQARHAETERRLAQARETHGNLRAALADTGALPSVRLAAKRDIDGAGADVAAAEADMVVAAAALAKAADVDRRAQADRLMPRVAAGMKVLYESLDRAQEARRSVSEALEALRALDPTRAQDLDVLAWSELREVPEVGVFGQLIEPVIDERRQRLRELGLLDD